MSKPAHKQDDPSKKPGQIKNDVTLGDYIERKTDNMNSKSVQKRLEIQKKKLTFDEWWNKYNDDSLCFQSAKYAWRAGQENK